MRRWGRARKPAVVLVHGAAGHTGWWHEVAPVLATRQHVLAFDLSGHGESARRRAYSLDCWAHELLAVVEHAGGRASVVAHSMGGSVALRAAALHPGRIERVVLVDSVVPRGSRRVPAGWFRPVGTRVYPTREAAIASFELRPRQKCDPDLLRYLAERSVVRDGRAWRFRFDPAVFAAIAAAQEQAGNEGFTGVGCPIDYIRGGASRVVDPGDVARLAGDLGVSMRVVEVPDAGHHVMLSSPGAVADAVRALTSDRFDTGGRGSDDFLYHTVGTEEE